MKAMSEAAVRPRQCSGNAGNEMQMGATAGKRFASQKDDVETME